jgi:hypothetical protein
MEIHTPQRVGDLIVGMNETVAWEGANSFEMHTVRNFLQAEAHKNGNIFEVKADVRTP